MLNDFSLIPKSIFDEDFGEDNVGWCSSDNISRLFDLDYGTVYIPKSGSLRYVPLSRRTRLDLIPCDDPKGEFIKHLREYKPNHETLISDKAVIHPTSVIMPGTIIERNVYIGANCTIGSGGFGYHNGEYIPHCGRVIIQEGARISNNVCIDTAVVGETLIGKNVKIDNLVHIAHGVKIGDGSYIVAGSVICGSVTLGKNVWVSPNATIRQHLTIGDNALIGMGAVVTKNVAPGQSVAGVPAKPIDTRKRYH